MSGSGISWATHRSVPRSRQITMPAPHHSVFYRPNALPAAQPTVSKYWRPSGDTDNCSKIFAGQKLLRSPNWQHQGISRNRIQHSVLRPFHYKLDDSYTVLRIDGAAGIQQNSCRLVVTFLSRRMQRRAAGLSQPQLLLNIKNKILRVFPNNQVRDDSTHPIGDSVSRGHSGMMTWRSRLLCNYDDDEKILVQRLCRYCRWGNSNTFFTIQVH